MPEIYDDKWPKVGDQCPKCPHIWGDHLVRTKRITCPGCDCSTKIQATKIGAGK